MISIVILTFNSRKLIKNCLDSIYTQDYPDIEVIIVDNGSRDGTVDLVEEYYPQVKLIKNRENKGPAKARNQAIEISKAKWILTLDCDVILEKDFLRKILKFADKLEDAGGMIQPKILTTNRKTIYSCGIYLSNSVRFFDVGKGLPDNGKFNKTRYIFGACSAAAIYRKKMLEDIKENTGYFDERFFFLVEDVDLSYRAQSKGYRALYYPEAVCYHSGNSSSIDRLRRQYLCWRNRRLMLKKYQFNRFKSIIISLFYDFPRFIYLILTNSYVRNEIRYE